MNYSGNMPDWHQYNSPQSTGTETTSTTQNVNANHLFNSSIAPRVLNGLNLSSDGLNKSQNDASYNSGVFQPSPIALNGHNGSENSLLTPMVQMSSCVGTYGTLTPRNPMMETLHLGSSPLDPRNRPAGALNETIAHRSSQMTLNGTMTHMSRPSMNVNGTLGPRSTRMNSIPPNRQGSYIPCKGPCCNQDLNACYQNWDKFGSYPPNVPYRENIGLTGYSTDNGQFRNDFNFRKDSFENKETLGPNPLTIDPCRNFPDYKYRKDSMIPRNYAPPPGLLQNYPMQNYNFTGDYQKYPYTIKDYPKENGICSQTPAILKYQEQSVIVQQKYTTKQIQYQNGGSLENGIVNPNVGTNVSRAQNPYFNSQFTRDFPRDFSRNNTDSKLGGNRIQTLTPMHGTYPQYQMYQQKIAMQRFSMENHLREYTSIPGYQSHPKYQEYVLRYKELLRLQQTIEYQSTTQEAPRVISTPVNDEIPPINLQFNQHGVLINSDCVPGSFSALQNLVNPAPDSENVQSTNIVDTGNQSLQGSEHFMSCLQNEESLPLHQETFQNQNRFMIQKDFDQERFQERQYKEKSFNILNPDDEEVATINHKNSKDFADKPELDVRQFLANWDESEEEEEEEEVGKEEREDNELNDHLQDAVLNNSTSVVIVEYENPSVDTQNSEKFGNFDQEDNCCNKEDTEGNQSEIESANLKNIQDCSIKAQVASDCNAQHLENDSNASDMVHFEEKNCNDIHCITNSTGNLPVIRTVDNLESETAVTKVQDAYQNMNSSDATVSLEISVAPVSENVQEEETVSPFENSENFQTKSIICETNSGKKDEIDPSVDSSETITVLKMEGCTATNSSSDCEKSLEVNEGTEEHTNAHEAAGLPMFPRNNLEHMENSSLQKQNSFMSEESHNPDDISLPDLPTSECTPFSTTLNTPIYSDSEESSEHVEDLTITTNPIEIIQNSPMLSFTHSPIKIEPYEHLDDERFVQKRSHDSLDFDFQGREHRKKKKSTDAFEDQSGANDRNFEIVNCISKDESTELSNAIEQRDKVPKNIKLFSSTKNNSLMTESNADLNSDIWLPSTSVKCELQDTIKEKRNKFGKAVEDSGTDKQLIDMLQSSKNVKDNKSENLSMSNIEMTKHVNRNKDYPTKMVDGKSEEKVNGIKNLELDSKMNKDVYDLQFNIKVNKLLESSSEMNFIHSNHEVCCSLVETNVFHASEDHEKLYTSSDHNKVYVQRVLDQPNFSSNSSMIPLIPGEDFEEPKMPVPPMEGNCLTKIMKNTSPITDLDVLGSDEEKLDKMDDIWVEVECTDKTLDTNLNIESVQNSFQEKSLHSKKLMKVHKSGWKHSKDARNCTSIKKSIKKILKAHKSKSNLNSNNQHLNNVKIHSNSTLIDNSTTFNNDSQNTIIDKINNTIDMFHENSTKDIDFSKKLVAQKSASNNEDNKCVIAFRESSKMQELIKEKGNHINDIATKLLENARIFEPELKKTEDSRSSMETSKERIKLLKEFRKSKNKPNTDQVQDDNKKSKLSVQSIQDDEKGTLESNNMKTEQKCMEIDVLTNSNQKINESLHCSTKEIKSFEHQDNNKLISSKDSNLIREGKDSSLKNTLLTNYRESLEQDTSITFHNHLDFIDKSKRDNNKSVESNLRSNIDSNFEIHSINSNQKIENDVTWKETLSTKEKNQDNVNGLDDLFQIETSAPYVESNCKLEEKSLQQTFVEADSKIEESSVLVLPQSTKCFPCSMKYCALVSKEFSKENATNVSAKLQIHNNNNNSDLATLTFEVHNKSDEIATRSQPELTNIKNATDKCTNRQDDVKETAVKNSLSKSQDDMKRQSENDIDVKDNCYLVNNKEKKKKLSTYLEIESHKVNDNTKCSSGYLVRAEDVVNHEDLVELPNKQEKEDAPLVIQHAVLPLMSTNEKSLQKCLATPGITKQLLYNNKQDDVPAETIKSSKIIKSPKPIENYHDRSFNEIDLNLSSTTNDNVETAKLASSFYLDFDNFDVAPNEDNEADIQMENWKYSKTNFRFEDCEKYKNPDSYVNPIFTSLDALENLNTVPIYTTKDGKITYSPNPKFTYRALILEAREREGYPTIRDSYYAKSNSYDYYDNSKRYKSKYNVTDHEKRRCTEYSNPKIYNESSPRHLNNSKYKNSIGSNGYYHRTVDQIKSNFQNYNGESSKKYNIENTKQQNICMNYKKPIEKFQYRGNKHYRKSDDRRSFDVTQSRSKGDTYYDCKKIKTVLPGAEKISSKNCRHREAMTGSVKRYSVNLNESCAIENITSLTSKTKLLDTLYKSSGHDDKILNALKFEIAPFKPLDIFLEDETYGRTLRNCDFVIKPPVTSCWTEDRRTNNFALGSREDVQMVLNDDLESLSEQTETEVTNGNNSQNVASDKNEISKSLITKKVLETVFEHTRNAITQIEDEQDLTSGKSEGSKSAIIEDVLKTSFEQVKNDIVIDVEQSFASREKNILESATSKKKLETIFEERNSNVKIVEDVQFVSEDLSKSTEDMKKGTMFKLMKNDAKHVKERCFFADECQVLKTTVLEQISEIASQQMNVKIDEAENENILDCEQELRKRKGTLDRKMNDSFTESNTKDPKEQKNKLINKIICDLRIGNVLPEKRIVEGSDFVEKEQNIISIQSKLSENQNATDSTVKEEAFKLSQKGILEDEDCMEVNNVSNNVFEKECDETNKCKLKNLGEIKEIQLDLGTVNSGTVNTSNIIENNISNQAKFVILKREDPVTFKKTFDKTDECKLEVPKKTEEIKLDPTNVNSGAVNMLNINEDNIHDQTKFFIKKKEVSVLETTLRNYENACFEESLLQTCQKQEHQKLERTDTFKTVSCMIEAREKFTVPLNSYVHEEHNSPLKSDIDIHCKDDKSSNVLEKMTDVDGLPKKELSRSSIQYQHENYTAYSPLKDSDDNSKTIPKIIIKKTEIGSKLSGKSSLSFAESRLDSIKGKVDSSFKLSSHPKIPRMIIRNAGSRPRTPVIEEVAEDSMSPKGEHKFFKVKIKLDEKQHNNEPDHFSKETESSENRIPKMKIKLEDKLPKMIVEDTSMESFGNSTGLRKTIPKMKIKKVRCALPKLMDESLPKIGIDMDTELEATFNTTEANMKAEKSDIDCNIENINESFTPNVKKKKEKINKLKVRKQNLRSVTSELSRKRHSLNLSQMQSKGLKKSLKEDLRWCNKNNVVETAQYLKIPEHNINTLHSISEKVPKVIIKRTSSNAEFKCELSKDRKDMIIKTKKWQPKVKLQRSWVLDCMAKMGDTEFALKLVTPGSSNEVSTYCRPGPKRSRWKRILSNQNCQRNFLRSDSTLDLIPVKRKQRSVSNYDFTKFIDSGTFSISRKLIARELNKGNTIQKMWCENFNKIEELRRFRLGSSGIINTTLCKFNENIGISYLLGPTLLNEYCKKMYIKFLRSDFNHSFNRIFLRKALENSETDFKENVRVLNFKILGEDGMTIKHSSKNSILEHTFLNENKQESDNFVNSLSFKMTEVRKRKKTNIKSDVHTINFENIASENTIVNLTESMPAESVCNTNSRSYTMYSEPSKIMDVTSNEMQVCTAQVQHYSDVTSEIFEEQDLHLNAVTHWDAVNSTQKTNDLFMNCVVSVVKDEAECKGTIVNDCIGTMLSDRRTENFVKKTVITGDKISSETTKNEDLSEGKTLTLNVPVVSNSFRDNDSSVIKVDSSDESQTTIEILPASPYFSQNEIEIHKSLDDCENDRLYSEDAIPTQFELELEIVDNNVIDSLDVPMPDVNESNDYVADYVDCRKHVKIDDRLRKESMGNVVPISGFNVIGDKNPSLSSNCQLSKDYFNHVEFSKNDVKQLCLWETNLNSPLTTAQDNDAREFDKEVLNSNTGKSLCCSELLVKEVLAAKEALRKCLKKSRNESRSKFKKRPKTAAEKKQGSSFDLSSLMNRSEACSKLDYGHDNSKYDQKVYDGSVLVTNNQCKTESKTNIEKSEKRHSKQNRSYCVRKKVKLMPSKNDESDRNVIQTEERYFSTCGLTNVKGTTVLARGGTMVSLRDSKRLIQSVLNNGNKNTSEVIELEDAIYKTKIQKLELQDGPGKSLLKVVSSRQKIESLHQEDKYNNCLEESMQNSEDGAIKDSIKKSGAEWLGKSFKSYKIPKISRSKDLQKDTTKESLKEIGDKEYKMPVLEPEVDSNYKPNSDRETSRSPPVITNQEVTDTFSQSPADFENKIEMSDCRLSDKEIGDSERESDVTIADIVNKLAYHEKATIKHRRYCTLCERWFPTVARHRRHLTGYQHRHTELTQRRTVHALFMLFTGKPCPKLQLANVVRTDYLLGELTPLQIAVQDVTMGLDKTNASRNQSEENK